MMAEAILEYVKKKFPTLDFRLNDTIICIDYENRVSSYIHIEHETDLYHDDINIESLADPTIFDRLDTYLKNIVILKELKDVQIKREEIQFRANNKMIRIAKKLDSCDLRKEIEK